MTIKEAILIATNYSELVNRVHKDRAISYCAFDFYNTAIGALNRALNELENDPQNARSGAITAALEAEECEKAVADEPAFVVDPSLHDRNKEITFLSIMASLAILHLFS